MKFSLKKFEEQSAENRKSTILKYLDEFERLWQREEPAAELTLDFSNYLAYFKEGFYKQLAENLHSQLNHSDYVEIAARLEQHLERDVRDQDFLVRQKDGIREKRDTFPLTLVLDNLRSAFNTGSIVRTGECFGSEEFLFCGYTPDNERVKKTAMGTLELVKIQHFARTEEALDWLKERQIYIYALETAENAESIYTCQYRYPAALIVGNEALGISAEILKAADAVIEIPLRGWKNSLNVAVATGIALSEMQRTWKSRN